jgi:hypothetical protein
LTVGPVTATAVADDDGLATFALDLPASLPLGPLDASATAGDAVATLGLVVLDPEDDADDDGLCNRCEVVEQLTAWDDPDTDGDGFDDGAELDPRDPTWPDAWTPTPVQLSDGSSDLYDLEVSGDRVLWAEDDGSEVWVADLDVAAGTLTPPNGRGTLVATDVAPFAPFQNGPEWLGAADPADDAVLYAKIVDGPLHVFAAREQDGTWVAEDLGPGAAPLGADWSPDGGGWIAYLGLDDASPNGLVSAWRPLDDPGDVRSTLEPVAALRFVPGLAEIVALRLQDGLTHTVVLDLDGTVTPVSDGPDSRITSNGWLPPERPGVLRLTSSVGEVWGLETRIEIFERDPDWRLVHTITPPPRQSRMAVVRPLVHRERSLVTFVAYGDAGAELWVTSAIEGTAWSRRLVVDPSNTLKDLEVTHDDEGAAHLLYRTRPDDTWLLHVVAVGPDAPSAP